MKIALTLPSLPLSGVGTSTGIIRAGLAEAGHDVTVIVTGPLPGDDFTNLAEQGWKLVGINKGVRFLRTRLERTLDYLRAFDVVINNTSVETQLIMPCLPSEVRRVSVMRALNETAMMQTSMNSDAVDVTIGISEAMVDALRAAPGIKSPVQLIPNCTTVTHDARIPLTVPLRLAYSGRLSQRDKNVLILPRIAAALQSKGIAFSLTIIGGGPAEEELSNAISEHGVENTVCMRGPVSREESIQLLKESHFVLIPSVEEGLSNVMLEAMAVGGIPITSDLTRFDWVLGDVHEGLQASLRDPNAYADKIAMLLQEPERYAAVQTYLRDRQREMFSPEKTVSLYRELLDNLVSTERIREPVPLRQLSLPPRYRRECSSWWRLAQVVRDVVIGPRYAT